MEEFDIFGKGWVELDAYLTKVKKQLDKLPTDMVRMCMDEAEEAIVRNASIIEFPDEKLAVQTQNKKMWISKGKTAKGRIINTSQHATYVEYGTGMVGASSPYPYGDPYPGQFLGYNVLPGKKKSDEYGDWYWWFKGKRNYGMPSYHIMYTSAREIERRLPELANKVMKGRFVK